MAKRFINIFFLLTFVTQLLPVKQVGRILFQACMVEEFPEKTSEKSATGFEDQTKHFLSYGNYLGLLFMSNSQRSYIHLSETLPVFMASDVQTPPPDFS